MSFQSYTQFLQNFDEFQNSNELYAQYFQYYIINLNSELSNNVLTRNLKEIASKYEIEYIEFKNSNDFNNFFYFLDNNISYFKKKIVHLSLLSEDDISIVVDFFKKITIKEEIIRESNLKLIFSCSRIYFNEIMNTDFYYHQTLTFIEDGVSLNVFDDYITLNELLQNNNLKKSKTKL